MVLDSGVKTPNSALANLRTAIEQALTLNTWVSRSRNWITSETFIRRHTQFDTVAEFCAACPCDKDTIGSVQRLQRDRLDSFVARTTDFETWAEMKQTAAVEDLISLQTP